MLNLSDKAIEDLRLALKKEIGVAGVEMLNNDDVNKIGLLLFSILAESLKMKND